MTTSDKNLAGHQKTALITGAARRIGAEIARTLHNKGYQIIIHCRQSRQDAEALATELNAIRADSAQIVQADLTDMAQVERLVDDVKHLSPQVDLLVNNASSFYPTPVADSSQQQWDDLINSNLRAAYFLTTGLFASGAKESSDTDRAVINLVDIHAQRGLPEYSIYSIAKAGLDMMTRTLAKDLSPHIRVNAVSPGPILWPEAEASLDEGAKEEILRKTLLGRSGTPTDIANAVCFLAEAPFITGQNLAVDGGRSLYS